MKIFLIGFMGSGKSRLGKKLAGELGLDLIDLDEWIIQHHNRTIKEIFSLEGEEKFREYEQQALLEIVRKPGFVLACGGGTPCYKDNMDVMNRNGKTVFLDVDEAILFERLSRNKTFRPLISNLDDSSLKKYIKSTNAIRRPYYKKAKIWINPLDTSIEILKKSLLI